MSRINFVEKGAFVLTYKKMIAAGVAWLVICFFIFLIFSGYSWYLGRSLEQNKSFLKQLNAQKDRALALVEASNVQKVAPDMKGLAEVFDHFPIWSEVMRILSDSLPAQVWLTSVQTQFYSENSTARKVEIGGMGRNTSSVARFVKQLNDKPLFYNVVLNKSSRLEEDNQNPGYSFVVIGDIRFSEKEWE